MVQMLISFLTLTSFLLLFSCEEKPDGLPQVIPEVTGSVVDEKGQPYPKTPILIFDGAKEYRLLSDAEGNFEWDTELTGAFEVSITPPLSTEIQGQANRDITIQTDQTQNLDFVIQTQSLESKLNLGTTDIFGEVRNSEGKIPLMDDEELYARNVFDPPIGLLTAIKRPDNQAVNLAAWKQAGGTVKVSCDGNHSSVELNLSGLIPGGTYTFWCNFLNKTKKPGEAIIGLDIVRIDPLGSGNSNVVVANSTGSITRTLFHGSCLLTEEVALVIPIIYHLNGKTFGSDHIPDEEDVSQLLVYFQ